MKRVFVQSELFRAELEGRSDASELLRQIEDEILKNPEAGDVVQGTGGVRKMRLQDAGRRKGKRGGLRVLFLDLPGKARTHLLVLYGKDQADDLTAAGKKIIKSLVESIKRN